MWKEVVGYEGLYEVNENGQIKRKARVWIRETDGASISISEMIMKPRVLRGYMTIGLTKDSHQTTKPVHRIIAEAFIPNPENKAEVNHIDGDKLNNCIDNLEWTTKSENDLHAFQLGLRKTTDGGTSKAVARLDATSKEILEVYPSLRELDRTTSFLRKEVSLACRKSKMYKGYYWKFI